MTHMYNELYGGWYWNEKELRLSFTVFSRWWTGCLVRKEQSFFPSPKVKFHLLTRFPIISWCQRANSSCSCQLLSVSNSFFFCLVVFSFFAKDTPFKAKEKKKIRWLARLEKTFFTFLAVSFFLRTVNTWKKIHQGQVICILDLLTG